MKCFLSVWWPDDQFFFASVSLSVLGLFPVLWLKNHSDAGKHKAIKPFIMCDSMHVTYLLKLPCGLFYNGKLFR